MKRKINRKRYSTPTTHFEKVYLNSKIINYKNISLLNNYLSELGGILPSHHKGHTSKLQRKIANEIKKARFLSLLTYPDM
jgi:small subunit ribosomal protein S18